MSGLNLVYNCRQVVTCQHSTNRPKILSEFSTLNFVVNGAMVFQGERILWVGDEAEIGEKFKNETFESKIDASGGVVTPGLVDSHTHPVFAACREDEFFKRNAGKSYMDIAKEGGGIRNSARRLRESSAEQLFDNAMKFLDRMLRSGTTTIEAKSGYGLSTESEIKSLEVIKRLNENHAIDLVPTFMGAHEFPDVFRTNREGYVELLINEMIPEVARRGLAKYCDIFTEAGVFDIDQSRRILLAAKRHGLGLKIHAEELKSIGGAELAAELGAKSADHLVHITDEGIECLAESGTIAVLLPSTTFFLGHKEYAPARKMVEKGVAVALSTDFNPGSSCNTSLPAVMTIAAIYLKLTAEEILNGVTYNAACAIDRQNEIGSLQEGKLADFVIWDVENFSQLPYLFAQNPVRSVYKRGRQVV